MIPEEGVISKGDCAVQAWTDLRMMDTGQLGRAKSKNKIARGWLAHKCQQVAEFFKCWHQACGTRTFSEKHVSAWSTSGRALRLRQAAPSSGEEGLPRATGFTGLLLECTRMLVEARGFTVTELMKKTQI